MCDTWPERDAIERWRELVHTPALSQPEITELAHLVSVRRLELQDIMQSIIDRINKHYNEHFTDIEAAVAFFAGKQYDQGYRESREKCTGEDCIIMGRWQEEIRHLIIDITGAPDILIDGMGCESGDPLDLTKTEINLGVGYMKDQYAKLQELYNDLKEKHIDAHMLKTALRTAQTIQETMQKTIDEQRLRIKKLTQELDAAEKREESLGEELQLLKHPTLPHTCATCKHPVPHDEPGYCGLPELPGHKCSARRYLHYAQGGRTCWEAKE